MAINANDYEMTDLQICKLKNYWFANLQIDKWPNLLIYKFTHLQDVQICKFTIYEISEFTNLQIKKLVNLQIYKFTNL